MCFGNEHRVSKKASTRTCCTILAFDSGQHTTKENASRRGKGYQMQEGKGSAGDEGDGGWRSPGPAVVPPTAAKALLKKVAMFCSLAVGGSPPT